MRRRRCRPFKILDAMILVAATAGGLALGRKMSEDPVWVYFSPSLSAWPATCFLLVWTVSFLLMRLWSPRPSLRRLMCQPGMAACCAVVVVTMIAVIATACAWVLRDLSVATAIHTEHWSDHSPHVGQAVALTWLGLLLSRRCRVEPGWIDRFGRAIGVLWLLMLLTDWRFGRWMLVAVGVLRGWMGVR
jgi:hypothetical protein